MYLEQALRAATAEAYPPAFALLRACLEHRAFDRLLFLASLHEDVIENVTDEMWERWQAAPPEHLQKWERQPGNKVHVVWRGVRVLDEDGTVAYMLSIYYRWWKLYDPFVTPGRIFDDVAQGHPSEKTSAAEYERAQHQIWQGALTWKNLKHNLILNQLASTREAAQWDVHHRFLSAFVHPFSENTTDDVYRPVYHGEWPLHDHYAMELALSYACTFAADELRDFQRMTEREPRVDLAAWGAVELTVTLTEAQIAHFWAPGRPPFAYDRVQEANQRVFDARGAEAAAGASSGRTTTPDPREFHDDEVRYYADPLRRLVRLHATSTELMSRLTWNSPWPRRDAR